MQIKPILGYFWAILGLYQPPPPPFWISASRLYMSWIRPDQGSGGKFEVLTLCRVNGMANKI